MSYQKDNLMNNQQMKLKNKIQKSYVIIRIQQLYYQNLTIYVKPIRVKQIYRFFILIIKIRITNNNQYYLKEPENSKKKQLYIQNKLNGKFLKNVSLLKKISSLNFVNYRINQSMESLDYNIKYESLLLDEEQ
ncbi:unnamed protein product [Paramecium pentaurelia]|uniref:Uncharacterized protein n=1 Tax=Paramecium pentaurelia TaxID=43138 RepID=A0A8S1WIX5_9CILI|nr:unnamed protein product [Paramecium pentaurelia]